MPRIATSYHRVPSARIYLLLGNLVRKTRGLPIATISDTVSPQFPPQASTPVPIFHRRLASRLSYKIQIPPTKRVTPASCSISPTVGLEGRLRAASGWPMGDVLRGRAGDNIYPDLPKKNISTSVGWTFSFENCESNSCTGRNR